MFSRKLRRPRIGECVSGYVYPIRPLDAKFKGRGFWIGEDYGYHLTLPRVRQDFLQVGFVSTGMKPM